MLGVETKRALPKWNAESNEGFTQFPKGRVAVDQFKPVTSVVKWVTKPNSVHQSDNVCCQFVTLKGEAIGKPKLFDVEESEIKEGGHKIKKHGVAYFQRQCAKYIQATKDFVYEKVQPQVLFETLGEFLSKNIKRNSASNFNHIQSFVQATKDKQLLNTFEKQVWLDITTIANMVANCSRELKLSQLKIEGKSEKDVMDFYNYFYKEAHTPFMELRKYYKEIAHLAHVTISFFGAVTEVHAAAEAPETKSAILVVVSEAPVPKTLEAEVVEVGVVVPQTLGAEVVVAELDVVVPKTLEAEVVVAELDVVVPKTLEAEVVVAELDVVVSKTLEAEVVEVVEVGVVVPQTLGAEVVVAEVDVVVPEVFAVKKSW